MCDSNLRNNFLPSFLLKMGRFSSGWFLVLLDKLHCAIGYFHIVSLMCTVYIAQSNFTWSLPAESLVGTDSLKPLTEMHCIECRTKGGPGKPNLIMQFCLSFNNYKGGGTINDCIIWVRVIQDRQCDPCLSAQHISHSCSREKWEQAQTALRF